VSGRPLRGALRYEVNPDWGRLPEGMQWGQISAVNVDDQDQVHLFARNEDPLTILDRDGRFVDRTGRGIARDPHGMCPDGTGGYLYVDRAAHVVVRYAADGTKTLELGNRDVPSDTGWTPEDRKVLRSAGPFNFPTDVAMTSDGSFYVSDGYRNARIHKFAADGSPITSWGAPGTGPGEFNLVHSVWEHAGRVFVADRENHRIQIFSPEGTYQSEWTGFVQPTDIYIDGDGLVYVSELAGRVTILDLKGATILRIGSPDDRAAEPGKFISPHGIWADRYGDIYVSEVTTGQRIQKFMRI
jgi:DNA-binding beta-propeller fold protein YncE